MNIPVPDVSVPLWQIRLEEPGDAARHRGAECREFRSRPLRQIRLSAARGRGADRGLVLCRRGTVGDKEVLRGSVRFWPIRVGGHEELLLGPLAVRGDQRGRGIGIALMQAGIEAARQGPWRGVLLVGDEPYYTRVGFSRLPPGRVKFPGPGGREPHSGPVAEGGRAAQSFRAKCAGRRSTSRSARRGPGWGEERSAGAISDG